MTCRTTDSKGISVKVTNCSSDTGVHKFMNFIKETSLDEQPTISSIA